ncbi:acyl-CoA dehydrogenase family protein [Streptomyces beihaiensis]|uniref:Acyl-CoA/acyl-ACP dehydrogenase n=1 Tax=Streptomyces beihaiensis TaxID=2984495 RepID=A0ABT3TW32_9ACTN|nr:acyl-CoA dehydrogenase family protein [Streptomyces beihaiensis]MCX3061229.1 acyl-CoA/acyl-ACP dehydrogenase [Streptomyces beihaiensis]
MSAQPDLLYSEDEEALRAAVRDLLADHCAAAAVLARVETDAPHDRGLWKHLAENMGLAGLLVPERHGGQGASHREAAVVLEELGRSVAPLPYLTSAVIATEALLACDTVEATGLLAALASGRTIGALAVPLSAGPGQEFTAVREEGGAVTGRVTGVADAGVADVFLVPTANGLYAVDAEHATVEPQTSFDRTRPLAAVTLADAPARPLAADATRAASAVRRALRAGAGLLVSEQLGVADWLLTETVRYTRERHQFNRPVGSFQALKHRLAHLWLEVVNARAVARNAADALATSSDDTDIAVAVAQAYAAPVAVHVAEDALQLHGGIGMTWEHPIHLYLKRAKADSIALGTVGRHREELAELVDLRAP